MSQIEEGKSIFSNIIWKFLERFFAQSVSLIISVILARILLPEDYGIVSIILIFITIANVFVSCGVATALIQKKDADSLDFSTVFCFNLFTSILLYIFLFFISPLISSFFDEPLLTPIIRVLSIKLIFAGYNSVQQAYVARKMMFRKFFWATLVGTVMSGIIGIICARRGLGAWSLAIQYLTNTVVDVIILQMSIDWIPSFFFSIERLKALWKFGWKILFEGLSSTVVVQLRGMIIGKVYTKADLAFYSKAESFPSLIVNTISTSISPVLLSSMSKVQDNNDKSEMLLRTAISVSSYIVFPLLIGLFSVAETFIEVILTSKWINSVVYLRFFCVINMITVVLIPSHQSLQARGRSDVFMIEHIIARICGIIVLILFFRKGVVYIAVSGLISSMIVLITVVVTNKLYNHYTIRNQISDIAPQFLIAIAMGLSVYLLNRFSVNKVFLLGAQVFIGGIVYFVLSVLFKPRGYVLVRQLLVELVNRRG